MTRSQFFLAMCCWSIFFTACSHDYQLMKTDEQLNGYGAAIRWGLFKKAAYYLSEPPQTVVSWDKLEKIKVTAYKPSFRDVYPSGKIITQTVEIHYLLDASIIEKTLIDEQRWRLDEEQDRWVLETGLPHFK